VSLAGNLNRQAAHFGTASVGAASDDAIAALDADENLLLVDPLAADAENERLRLQAHDALADARMAWDFSRYAAQHNQVLIESIVWIPSPPFCNDKSFQKATSPHVNDSECVRM